MSSQITFARSAAKSTALPTASPNSSKISENIRLQSVFCTPDIKPFNNPCTRRDKSRPSIKPISKLSAPVIAELNTSNMDGIRVPRSILDTALIRPVHISLPKLYQSKVPISPRRKFSAPTIASLSSWPSPVMTEAKSMRLMAFAMVAPISNILSFKRAKIPTKAAISLSLVPTKVETMAMAIAAISSGGALLINAFSASRIPCTAMRRVCLPVSNRPGQSILAKNCPIFAPMVVHGIVSMVSCMLLNQP